MADKRNSPSQVNCFTCQHRNRSEWCVLTDDEVGLLDQHKVCKEYHPGEIIFHEGDPCRGVYCLESGLVGIRKTDADGNSVLVRIVYPGDSLGYRPFLAGEDHRGDAEVLKPSALCFIEKATVRELLDRNPALGMEFLKIATRSLGEAEEKYFQNITLDIRARLIHLLLVLKERHGTTAEDGSLLLELPLSRRDMAAMLGIRPESISRVIHELDEEGVATFSGRTVHVREVDILLNELRPESPI